MKTWTSPGIRHSPHLSEESRFNLVANIGSVLVKVTVDNEERARGDLARPAFSRGGMVEGREHKAFLYWFYQIELDQKPVGYPMRPKGTHADLNALKDGMGCGYDSAINKASAANRLT